MPQNRFKIQKIDASEIKATPRGRKANIDPALIDALRDGQKGQAYVMTDFALDAKAANYKTEKARVSAMLRKAASLAGHQKVAIRFTPEGVPQIAF